MKAELNSLIKEAMISKNEIRLKVLRLIKSKFSEFETAKNAVELTDEAEVNILKGMVKQRAQSIEAYYNANRYDLVESEKAEILVIESFLPAMVSDSELKSYIESVLTSKGITDMKGMGIVMGSLKSKYGSSFDAGVANKLFRELLNL